MYKTVASVRVYTVVTGNCVCSVLDIMNISSGLTFTVLAVLLLVKVSVAFINSIFFILFISS